MNHEERANHLQDSESSIVLISNQSQLCVHPIDSSVGDVDAVQEGKEEQQTEDGNNADVDLPDQRRLVEVLVYLPGGGLFIVELGEMPVSRGSQGTRSWWRVTRERQSLVAKRSAEG